MSAAGGDDPTSPSDLRSSKGEIAADYPFLDILDTVLVLKADFEAYVRRAAANGGPGSEIAHAKQLLDAGDITRAEYDQITQKAPAV
jgi:hypothetical protein